MRIQMTEDDVSSYGDVYLAELSKSLDDSKDEHTKLLDWINELSENNFNLIKEIRELEIKFNNLKFKSNDWLEDLKKAEEVRLSLIEEIKNLKAEVKYERQLRLEGAKHH